MKILFIFVFFMLIVSSSVNADRFGLLEDRDDIYYSESYGYAKNIVILFLVYLIIYLHIKHEKKESNLSFSLFLLEKKINNQFNEYKKYEIKNKEYIKDNLILRENLILYFDDDITKEDLFDETVEILEKEYDQEWDDLYEA